MVQNSPHPFHHLYDPAWSDHPLPLHYHCYADDTQMYISITPTTLLPPQSIVNYFHEIKTWMTTNQLKLNPKKTELMVTGSKSQLEKSFSSRWMAVPSLHPLRTSTCVSYWSLPFPTVPISNSASFTSKTNPDSSHHCQIHSRRPSFTASSPLCNSLLTLAEHNPHPQMPPLASRQPAPPHL